MGGMGEGNIESSLLENKIITYPLITLVAMGSCYVGSFFSDQKFYNTVNEGVKTIIDYLF